MTKNRLDESPTRARWTRVDTYFFALAKLRTVRRRHALKPRTQPEQPIALLSTFPFLALLAALGVLAAAIAIVAWPGRQPSQPRPAAEAKQPGTAPSNWFEEAKREMRDE